MYDLDGYVFRASMFGVHSRARNKARDWVCFGFQLARQRPLVLLVLPWQSVLKWGHHCFFLLASVSFQQLQQWDWLLQEPEPDRIWSNDHPVATTSRFNNQIDIVKSPSGKTCSLDMVWQTTNRCQLRIVSLLLLNRIACHWVHPFVSLTRICVAPSLSPLQFYWHLPSESSSTNEHWTHQNSTQLNVLVRSLSTEVALKILGWEWHRLRGFILS